MKLFYFSILIIAIFFSNQAITAEDELENVFHQMKTEDVSLPNKLYSKAPTQDDIQDMEKAIQQTLPECLKRFFINCGNLSFAIIFPTIQNDAKSSESYESAFLDFFKEGYGYLIQHGYQKPDEPLKYLPFCQDNDAYVCLELTTQTVHYFTSCRQFQKVKPQPYSSWLKSRLLRK